MSQKKKEMGIFYLANQMKLTVMLTAKTNA